MKKVCALLLALVLMCGMLPLSVFAATNQSNLFEQSIRNLQWVMNETGQKDVKTGKKFSTETIARYTFMTLQNTYYDPGSAEVHIPVEVFEKKAQDLFGQVDRIQLRKYKTKFPASVETTTGGAIMDTTTTSSADTTPKMESQQAYNEGLGVYRFMPESRHWGDITYVLKGYRKSGTLYTVYGYVVDTGKNTFSEKAKQNKDFVYYQQKKCKIVKFVRQQVETDSLTVRFHSWETVKTLPDEKLTYPGMVITEKQNTTTTTVVTDKKGNTVTQKTTTREVIVTEKKLETVMRNSDVQLDAEPGTLEDTARLTADQVTDGKLLKKIETAASLYTREFVAYRINAITANEEGVALNGKMLATYRVPTGYNSERVLVLYYDEEDDKVKRLTTQLTGSGSSIQAEVEQFGVFVVAEALPNVVMDEDVRTVNRGLILTLVLVALFLLIGGGAVWYFMFYRKRY